MKFKKTFLLIITFILIITGNVYATAVDENEILVPTAILVENNTNKILYEKNANQKMYPASLTKIMTALVVLDNCTLEEEATVTYSAISEIPDGYTTANLVIDEVLSINDLLHLMLIESANDAANVLAEHVAGSIESFATMMNTKAYELGCTKTNFTNPYGLHNDNHYSTAYDLYLIAKNAMSNQNFRNIVSKYLYVVYPTNKVENERKVENTNSFLDKNSNFYDKRVIGVKTGFTTPAGNCLITCANDKNMEVITVVLGGGLVDEETPNQQYTSTQELINYAFNNYSYKITYNANDVYKTVEVKNADENSKNLNILVKDTLNVFGDNETLKNNITPKVELNDTFVAPIKAGDVLGTISYEVMGSVYTSNLIAESDVNVSPTYIILFSIFIAILITFVGYRLKKTRKKKKYRKRH